MENLHSSHIGIEGCLRRAREHVYWPGMNAALKDYMGSCEICLKFRHEQQKEPMMSHELPERAWEVVSTDIFELKGHHFIIAVDHYSDFFEMERLSNESATQVIKFLKNVFSRHGIPTKLISDNGPQYSSEEFRDFAKKWSYTHITSSPHYPQSNGRAEGAVKSCESLMMKALEGKEDFQLALLALRNTPTETTGLSPVQRLFNRRTRTLAPTRPVLLNPEVHEGVKDKIKNQERSKPLTTTQEVVV